MSTNADESAVVQRTATTPGPVPVTERLTSVDTLRGVAVLGILVMNITSYALPDAAYFSPVVDGALGGINGLTWWFSQIFFSQKMMAIFSMLFGAGVVLMSDRAASSGRKWGGIHYRRMLWLLLFGVAHGYLLWQGDILYNYALCGLLLFPMRRLAPKWLTTIAIVSLLIGVFLQVGSGMFFYQARETAATVEQKLAEGEPVSQSDRTIAEVWYGTKMTFEPSAEQVAQEVAAMRGSYAENLAHRAPITLMMQTQVFLFFMLPRVLGMMLIGMALMKAGVFAATRSRGFYIKMLLIGYGVGFPLTVYGTYDVEAHGHDFAYRFLIGGHFDYVGSILIALGHIAVIMLLCKSNVLEGLKARLAAVGRMALSNYLIQTIIGVTIFHGVGLGLFNRVERAPLLLFVLGIWVVQMVYSPIWLRNFRFGPFEWLWRSLTYWRRQPMRSAQAVARATDGS